MRTRLATETEAGRTTTRHLRSEPLRARAEHQRRARVAPPEGGALVREAEGVDGTAADLLGALAQAAGVTGSVKLTQSATRIDAIVKLGSVRSARAAAEGKRGATPLTKSEFGHSIGTIALDNPAKRNALCDTLVGDIIAALAGFAREKARAVVLRSAPGVVMVIGA